MKKLFTIELFHEFDGEAANHLSFFLAETNHSFIKNNRIWIKTNSGLLDCYIEDDLSIQKEAKTLYFWIVCTDNLFYSYTYYPSKINFNTPFFFSTINPTKNPQFKTNTIRIKFRNKDHPDGIVPLTEITGKMPKNAIGCLGVQIDKITDFSKITIPFPVRKTYWQYHLMTNSVHNPIFKPKPDTVYNIVDNDFEQKKTKDKWEFLKMPESQ